MGNERHILANLTETEIIQCLREGDERVVRFVYEENKSSVFNYIRQIRISLPKEDLYQEAFMVMMSNIYEKDLSCKISTFLYSVVRNLSLKELRVVSKESDQLIEEVDTEVDNYHAECERISLIEAALLKLGAKCQSIIKHYYMFNWSMEDIAQKFAYTNALNAKNQKYKCMKKLKELMHV